MSAPTGRFTLALVLVLAAAPAAADYRLEKRLDLAPGGRFILSSAIGQVSVTGDGADGAQILLTTTLDQKELEDHYDVRFEQSAGLAKLTIERRGGWLGGVFGGDWFRGQKARIEVHVPRQTAVELTTSGGSIQALSLDGKVEVVSSGGRVEVREVRGEVTVGSSGGGVEILEVEGPVNAESSGGSVELERVSGEIHAESSGGGVHVRGAGGRVEASSSGGSVEVSFAAGNGDGGEISSSGGGVQVEVDPTVALSIDASSSGGSVHCDLPVTVQGRIGRDSLHGRLNGGGATLRLRSSGGGVRLASLSD
jgi:hypothetical protein